MKGLMQERIAATSLLRFALCDLGLQSQFKSIHRKTTSDPISPPSSNSRSIVFNIVACAISVPRESFLPPARQSSQSIRIPKHQSSSRSTVFASLCIPRTRVDSTWHEHRNLEHLLTSALLSPLVIHAIKSSHRVHNIVTHTSSAEVHVSLPRV